MTTTEQNSPIAAEQRDEEPTIVRDTTASPTDREREPSPPPLPQRPLPTSSQPLPQPFHNQTQPVYMPFAAQPNQQLPYATPVRPLPHQTSAYLATRLGLTVLSSIWGIIIIALTSILLSQGGSAASVSIYAYAIVVVSIIWNTAELITYCVRLRKEVQRGIHPGAHVGLHLLFWLAGVLASLLSVGIYVGEASSLASCERGDDDDDYYYYSSSYCDEYQPYSYYKGNIIPVFRALVAIFILWTINHFVLFVMACIETHKRNSMRPAAFIMPAQAVTAGPIQGVYYPQVAGMQPQPMQYYPYPIVMQPPPPAQFSGAQTRTQVTNEKQPAQPYQNIAGFYAPAAGPSARPASNNASVASPGQEANQVQ